jgi:hypothetical protein
MCFDGQLSSGKRLEVVAFRSLIPKAFSFYSGITIYSTDQQRKYSGMRKGGEEGESKHQLLTINQCVCVHEHVILTTITTHICGFCASSLICSDASRHITFSIITLKEIAFLK